MKHEYVIKLTKPIGTNTYDTFTMLRTADFNHYRECRLLLVESLNKLGLCKDLEIHNQTGTLDGEAVQVEVLYIIIKE